MNTPSQHSPPGSQGAIAAGRYPIVRELGSGGMGVVYLCDDSELGRQVAIKTLIRSWRSSKEVVSMFLSEARALAGLDHPGLVRVHDVLAEEEAGERVPYLVMEYVKGQPLESLISERSLPLATALSLLAEIADALAYCHTRGILHRDVKPANILVTETDATEPGGPVRHAKLIDFGIARSLSALALRGTQLRGTPAYMAPEQVLGDRLSPATDLYALGVTIYEAVSGQLPFADGEVMAQHVMQAPPPLRQKAPGIPRSLERLVMRCLAKDPSDRPKDCIELRDGLLRIASELDPSAAVATRISPVRPTELRPRLHIPERRRGGLWLFGLALAAGLAGVVWLQRAPRSSGDGASMPATALRPDGAVPQDGAMTQDAGSDAGTGIGPTVDAGRALSASDRGLPSPDAGAGSRVSPPDAAADAGPALAPPAPTDATARGAGRDARGLRRGPPPSAAARGQKAAGDAARPDPATPGAASAAATRSDRPEAPEAALAPARPTEAAKPVAAPETAPGPTTAAESPPTPPAVPAPRPAARPPQPVTPPTTAPTPSPKMNDVPLSF